MTSWCYKSSETFGCSCSCLAPSTLFPNKIEDETELSQFKPQLSLMRDRDKRRSSRVAVVPASLSSSLIQDNIKEDIEIHENVILHSKNSSKREEKKTNDCCADCDSNSCPMGLLNWIHSSVLFYPKVFLSPFSSSTSISNCCCRCSCHSSYKIIPSHRCCILSINDDNNNGTTSPNEALIMETTTRTTESSSSTIKLSLQQQEIFGMTTERPFSAYKSNAKNFFSIIIPFFLIISVGLLSDIVHCTSASLVVTKGDKSYFSPTQTNNNNLTTIVQMNEKHTSAGGKEKNNDEIVDVIDAINLMKTDHLHSQQKMREGTQRHQQQTAHIVPTVTSQYNNLNQMPLFINNSVPITEDVEGDGREQIIKLNKHHDQDGRRTLRGFNMNSSVDERHSRKENQSESVSEGKGGVYPATSRLKFISSSPPPRDFRHYSKGRNKSSSNNNNGGDGVNGRHVLMGLPLALKMRTQSLIVPPYSSSSISSSLVNEQQLGKGKEFHHVTNELSRGSSFDDGEDIDEGSENFNDSDNIREDEDDDGDDVNSNSHNSSFSSLLSFPGLCWFYDALSSNEGETMREMATHSYFPDLPFSTTFPADISTFNSVGVFCNGTSNLGLTVQRISDSLASQVISLRIKDSSITTLNLSLFHRFPRLENLSVTNSNVSQIIGTCPIGLLSLNISFNSVRRLDSSVFHGKKKNYENSYKEDNGYNLREMANDKNYFESSVEGDNDLKDTTSIEFNGVGNYSTENISTYLSSRLRKPQYVSRSSNNYTNESGFFHLLSQSKSASSSLEKQSFPRNRITRGNSVHFENQEADRNRIITETTRNSVPIKGNGGESESSEEVIKSRGISRGGNPKESHSYEHRRRQLIRKIRQISTTTVNTRVFDETGKTINERKDDDVKDAFHEDNNDLDVTINVAASIRNNDPETKQEEKISSGSSNIATDKKDRRRSSGGPAFSAAGNGDCRNNNNYSLCKPSSQVPIKRRRRSSSPSGRNTGMYENDISQQEDSMRKSYGRELKSESSTVRMSSSEGIDEDYSLKKTLSSSSDDGRMGRISGRITAGDDASGSNKEGSKMKLGGGSKSAHLNKKVVVTGMRSSRASKRERSLSGSLSSSSGGSNIGVLLSLQDVDLSYNKISEVPSALLELKGLKSLRLSGNQLKYDFVWDKLAEWYMKTQNRNILKDGDDTFCGVVDDVRVFQFTVLGVLKAKKDVVETCSTVDKTICECGLYSLNKQAGQGYNLSHQSPRGNVSVSLRLDCSDRNLTELPPVPLQTWQLNVSGNYIKDLSPLKQLMYENLLILDADSNEISTLDGLTGTSFLDKYNYLSLQNNHFTVIPSNILSSMKTMRGQGVTFLGANFVECDCEVVKEIKPLLLENSKQIKDLKEIFCKNMKAHSGDSLMSLKNLQYTDLCYLDTEESNEMYLYLVIFIELLLIFVIVAKVWHDQRTFRRTGRLPWCSDKMPRLPCDAMLESVKEPPNFNRSSSTNVRSFACSAEHPTAQSISSHVQLREVRSNSGQSEKSSQISQLSSFPSSSRTSSV